MLVFFLCVLYFRVAGNCPLVLKAICDAKYQRRVPEHLKSVSGTSSTRLKSFSCCFEALVGDLR